MNLLSRYGEPDLLVLDDPLSAVDPEVCRRIFDQAVRGFAEAGGAVVMACNQIHLLSQCDDIIMLQKGRVAERGTYTELMAAGRGFRNLVDKHVHEDVDADAPDAPCITSDTATTDARDNGQHTPPEEIIPLGRRGDNTEQDEPEEHSDTTDNLPSGGHEVDETGTKAERRPRDEKLKVRSRMHRLCPWTVFLHPCW